MVPEWPDRMLTMKYTLLLLLCSVGAAVAADQPAEPAQGKAKNALPAAPTGLQGEWLCVRTGDGTPLYLGAGLSGMAFQDGTLVRYDVSLQGGKLVRGVPEALGTFVLQPTQQTKAIDVTVTAGPNQGKTIKGIYRLEAGALALNLGKAGADRPQSLEVAQARVWKRAAAFTSGEELYAPPRLPLAVMARRADPQETDRVHVNLTDKGDAMLDGKAELLAKLPAYLRKALIERGAEPGKGGVKTAVVLRAAPDVDYGPISEVVAACRKQGFGTLGLRVTRRFPSDDEEAKIAPKERGAPELFGSPEFELTLVVGELNTDLTVHLAALKDGLNDGVLSGIVVESNGARPVDVADLDVLRVYLAGMRKNLANPDGIRIRADSALKYSFAVDAMNACLKAGFTRVGFSAPKAK